MHVSTLLVWLQSEHFAQRVRDWLPDMVRTGLRRATLFHSMDDTRGRLSEELEGLRPELDRLAVALTSHSVQTDVALKRGDPVPWLLALAASRHADLIVVETPTDAGAANRLLELLEQARCPVLAMPATAPTRPAGVDATVAAQPHAPA